MKKLLLLLLCVPLIFSCGNQETKVEGFCVEGDCENGTGTFVYADGEKYVGEWSNGLRDGEGTLIIYSPATSDAAYLINRNEVFYHAIKFEGVWKEGKKNGYLTIPSLQMILALSLKKYYILMVWGLIRN